MVVARTRNAQLIIDSDALYENVANEKKRLPNKTALFVVLKANAYGHGAVQTARVCEAAGADGFCVALLDEAIELREAGFTQPIMVLGITNPSYLNLAEKYDVSLTVSSADWLAKAAKVADTLPFSHPINLFFAIDTGMGRIGMRTAAELKDAQKILDDYPQYFNLEGIFTHFATADEQNDIYFKQQKAKFNQLKEAITDKPKYISEDNSAASLYHGLDNTNMVRYGVAAYGLNPKGTDGKSPFPLHPVMSLTSELIYVKKVPKGTSIGYGATYTTDEDSWIGTVPLGYADGIKRSLQGFSLLVNGQRCPIVGRVCMDQLMIKLPGQFPTGTKVTLIGKNHGQEITLQEMADYCHTIHYELACGFSPRLQRIYKGKKSF